MHSGHFDLDELGVDSDGPLLTATRVSIVFVRAGNYTMTAPSSDEQDPLARRPPDDRPEELLDMIWPETGLQVTSRAPRRPKDGLTEDDTIEIQIDFLTISLTPLEFIQLASFFRMTVDELLERHPGLQRAVVRAFDIRD